MLDRFIRTVNKRRKSIYAKISKRGQSTSVCQSDTKTGLCVICCHVRWMTSGRAVDEDRFICLSAPRTSINYSAAVKFTLALTTLRIQNGPSGYDLLCPVQQSVDWERVYKLTN